MKTFLFVTLCLFAAWDPVNCQEVNRTLEPWLQGVIAVSVFLVLAMICFVINKICCQDEKKSTEDKQGSFMNRNTKESIFSNGMEGTYAASAADFSCEDGPHVYENQVAFECDTRTEHHTENHVNADFHCGTMSHVTMSPCHTESCSHADVTTCM